MSYLQSKAPVGLDEQGKSRTNNNAKKFVVWKSRLFRRSVHVLRADIPTSDREKVLKCFHDDNGHWDLEITPQFVTERYWWPTM